MLSTCNTNHTLVRPTAAVRALTASQLTASWVPSEAPGQPCLVLVVFFWRLECFPKQHLRLCTGMGLEFRAYPSWELRNIFWTCSVQSMWCLFFGVGVWLVWITPAAPWPGFFLLGFRSFDFGFLGKLVLSILKWLMPSSKYFQNMSTVPCSACRAPPPELQPSFQEIIRWCRDRMLLENTTRPHMG